jgi:integration host factor alpha subunit
MAETMIPFGHAVPDHRNEASVEPQGTPSVASETREAPAARHPAARSTVAQQPSVHLVRPDSPTPAAAPGGLLATAGTYGGVVPTEAFTLTKAELAEMLFERVGLNKREAKDMVETFFDEIRGALERGGCVKLSGFGNFQLRDKPQRPGRNPKTGEEIPISARRVVTFHASQKLKSQIEGTES